MNEMITFEDLAAQAIKEREAGGADSAAETSLTSDDAAQISEPAAEPMKPLSGLEQIREMIRELRVEGQHHVLNLTAQGVSHVLREAVVEMMKAEQTVSRSEDATFRAQMLEVVSAIKPAEPVTHEKAELKWRDVIGDVIKLVGGRAAWISAVTVVLAIFFVGASFGIWLSPSEASTPSPVAVAATRVVPPRAQPDGGPTVEQWQDWLWSQQVAPAVKPGDQPLTMGAVVLTCVTKARSEGRSVTCALPSVLVN